MQAMNSTTINQSSQETWNHSWLNLPGWLVLFAISYNSFLAVVNAHVMTMVSTHVALTESLILMCVMGYIALNMKKIPNIYPHLMFLLGMAGMSVWVMLTNDGTFIKILRDCLIMVAFVLLGTFLSSRHIINIFKLLMIAVLSVAVVEIFFTELYVTLFEPAKYYESTRGIEPFQYSDSGLFRNSLGYSSRFSFNFLSSHRISSIFLEQVSLANFAMVTLVFLMGFGKIMRKREVLFFILSVLFLILTNDTRTGALFALALIPGFFIFPMLPRWFAVTFIPGLLLLAGFAFYDPNLTSMTDDFAGRIGFTLYLLADAELDTLLMGNLAGVNSVADSGYAYMLYATTLFGLIFYWLYTALVIRSDHPADKRYVFSMNAFIAINLMIGAAIFTIKISAPLWVMVGYLYTQLNITDKEAVSHD